MRYFEIFRNISAYFKFEIFQNISNLAYFGIFQIWNISKYFKFGIFRNISKYFKIFQIWNISKYFKFEIFRNNPFENILKYLKQILQYYLAEVHFASVMSGMFLSSFLYEWMFYCQKNIRSIGECTNSIVRKRCCFFLVQFRQRNELSIFTESFFAYYSVIWFGQ